MAEGYDVNVKVLSVYGEILMSPRAMRMRPRQHQSVIWVILLRHPEWRGLTATKSLETDSRLYYSNNYHDLCRLIMCAAFPRNRVE